ncbi:PEGA domain-containing protein [Thiohalospira halophila DSM 15071]|uniref:PEGA domain-containing protein n=1 Tax=Thiohalospira halophila DSM 15071 TaxID=1123397 RepID=A0A1I1TYJ4_9GAMM|nr:PEGA domain-containing protein [Thiohalospira halophila]SFD61493.1 PEGA domain-containing protein [Thiohalospira halophila DSM 15071]
MPRTLPLVAALLVATLPGCALLPATGPDAGQLADQGRQAVPDTASTVYGHGTGPTREAARQAASRELARALLTHVRAELRIHEQELADGGGARSGRRLESATASLANVTLEGVTVDAAREGRNGWYVRAAIERQRLDELRQRARRQAAALAWFEITVAEEQPGRAIRAALRGLTVAARTGVIEEAVYHPEVGNTTFGAWFEQVILERSGDLRILPLVEEDGVRLAVIHADSYRPQPGFPLEVDGQRLTTDEEGITAALKGKTLAGGTAVRIPDSPLPTRYRRLATLNPDRWADLERGELFIHTEPAGATALVDGRGTTTPGRLPLEPGEYTLEVTDAGERRGAETTIDLAEGAPYAYATLELAERHFGRLDLRVADDDARIRITRGPRKDATRHEARGALESRLDVGRYDVAIDYPEDEDYQTLTDDILLHEDETVARDYIAPPSRQPYTEGSRGGLTLLSLGDQFGQEFALPGENGGEDTLGELEEEHGASQDSVGFMLLGQLQGFWSNHLTLSGEVGIAMSNISADHFEEQYGEGELTVFQVRSALGAGLWFPAGENRALWATYNLGVANASWSEPESGYPYDDPPGGSVTNNLAFAEVGLAGSGYSVALRLPLDERTGAHFTLTWPLMSTDIERGYRREATRPAREGEEYTKP